jgi:hypothetical protein
LSKGVDDGPSGFFGADGIEAFVAALGEGAASFKAGATGNVMAEDGMAVSAGAGPAWFGATEDGDDANAESGGEVHGAGVIGQEQVAGG